MTNDRTQQIVDNPGYEHRYFRGKTWEIGFDMDSVLNDGDWLFNCVAKYFNTTVSAILGRNRAGGYRTFNFNIPGITDEGEIVKAIEEAVIKESPSAMASPYMREVTEYVYEVTKKPILVITYRAPGTPEVTKNWLSENLTVPFVCVICNGMNKHHALRMTETQIFIDDRWKTIKNLSLLNVIPYPVMYQRPWNQGRPGGLKVHEIRDLRDIIPLLNIQLGRNPMDWPVGLCYPLKRGDLCFER